MTSDCKPEHQTVVGDLADKVHFDCMGLVIGLLVEVAFSGNTFNIHDFRVQIFWPFWCSVH